jgi:hypothetical protein
MTPMATYAVSGMTCMKSPAASVSLKPPRAVIDSSLPLSALNGALGGKYVLSELRADPLAFARVYYPLFLVIGLIAVASLAGGSFMAWMMNLMAGWFVVFGAFKLLDVPAFATAYRRYDLIAKAVPAWGYAYPFVELAIGFAFLFNWQIGLANWAALLVSLIGAAGVIQAVLAKQTIQCACLGTVFKLPMSTVTIVENLGMAAMAAWMIWAM